MNDSWLWRFARWANPRLLRVSRYLTVGLLATSLLILFLSPRTLMPYLATLFFVGVLYLLLYLEQIMKGKGPS